MCQMSGVKCHVSGVSCQVSGFRCHAFFCLSFLDKVVKLVGAGSVINGAYHEYFWIMSYLVPNSNIFQIQAFTLPKVFSSINNYGIFYEDAAKYIKLWEIRYKIVF